jgi:hypothetical protein
LLLAEAVGAVLISNLTYCAPHRMADQSGDPRRVYELRRRSSDPNGAG